MPPSADQEQLLRDQRIGVLATLRRDGSVHLTPVNFVYHQGRILISITRDRVKYHNVRRDPRVSLCVMGPDHRPYVSVSGRARIEEDDIEAGTAHIARSMSDRPLPDNFGDLLRQQQRVLIILTPERFLPRAP
jgi:PPOX class probable F420-dependent enzyme